MTLEVLTAHAPGSAKGPPLLFVHGAFLGAWCWAEYFLPWFAERGYDAHAVSLRGHGASGGRSALDAASLDDYVADVVLATREFRARPVLVGHSMGAIVVQRAARRCDASGLVLLAPVPPQGLGGSLLSLALRDPPLFTAIGAVQLGAADASAWRGVRDYLFSKSLTEADVWRYLRRTQRESQRALLELAWPQYFWVATSIGLPVLVLGAADDAFFTPGMTYQAAGIHGMTPEIFPDLAHMMMLEPGWRHVAQRILLWLERRGGTTGAFQRSS